MSPVLRICATLLAALLVPISLSVPVLAKSSQGKNPSSSAATAATIPVYDHIFTILMENTPYSGIIGNPSAPYINSLASQGSIAGNYFATDHPSLPNYAELTSGQAFANAGTDCDPSPSCQSTSLNIVDRLNTASKSWKSYQESMGSSCGQVTSYPYAPKHNPFVYYTDISAAICSSQVVDYSNLASDLASTTTTANYNFITPNLCNDMHDCATSTGDSWLASAVPTILNSPAFTTQKSLLVLVWDEDDNSQGNQVAWVAVGYGVKVNYTSSVAYTHYSFLRTIESSWGMAPLTSNDSSASVMSDIFTTPSISASYVTSNAKTSYVRNTPQSFSITATNTGNTTWRTALPNPVQLGVHFANTGGGYGTNTWYTDAHYALSGDVAPGAPTTFNLVVSPPALQTGNLVLEFEMVTENVAWFPQFSDVPVTVDNPDSTSYVVTATPTSWSQSQTKTFSLTLNNTSTIAWVHTGANPTQLGVHFANTGGGYGHNTWFSDQHFALPSDVAPGASVTMNVSPTSPSTTGSYVLEFEMVHENQFWFSSVADVNVSVVCDGCAAYSVLNTPTSWVHGTTRTYTLSVTNTSGVSWVHTGANPYQLGVHFSSTGGGYGSGIWYTDSHYGLNANIAPGATANFNITIPAPLSQTGSMKVEYEMVHENVFWFPQFSDTSVTVS